MWIFCLHLFLTSAQWQIFKATHRIKKPNGRSLLRTAGCRLIEWLPEQLCRVVVLTIKRKPEEKKAEAQNDLAFQNIFPLWPNGLLVPYFLDRDGVSSLSGNDAAFQGLHHNLAFHFYGLFQGPNSRMSEQKERISDFSKGFRVM